MSTVFHIAWLTFHEARQRRMVLVALLLGLCFVLLFALGVWWIDQELQESNPPALMEQRFYNFLLMAGLYVVHFLTIMIAIFSSVDTVAGEIASHTIQTIVTRPVRRWQIIIGKWVGHALMIGTYLLLLCGGVVASVFLIGGYLAPNLLHGLSLLLLEALVLLALSLLVGSRFSSLTNGMTLFMLYGLAFIGAWVEQIGGLLQSGPAVRIGIVSSLLLPVEALWRRAAYLMQPATPGNIPISPFSVISVPSAAMVAYAVGYMLLMLLLATLVFGRRDL
jgi:ABC-type transport system involved in multi-copper enzyme maturation permease subunit